MVVVELILSYSKLVMCFFFIGLAFFYLLFKVMSGGAFYYYSRTSNFIDTATGVISSNKIGEKFKPIFKRFTFVPIQGGLYIEGVFANGKKIKRLEIGKLKDDIIAEQKR